VEIISLSLSLFAIILSIWFWKNPIDISFVTKKTIIDDKDPDSKIAYCIGKNNKGWLIEKIMIDEATSGKEFTTYASKKNNPKIKHAPSLLEEIKKLNFN